MTRTAERKALSIIVASILFAVYTVFIIYLGLYAYGNPDPYHCFYIDGLDTPGTSKANAKDLAEDRGIEVRTGYPIDMAHLFQTWFIWGFWDKMLQISIIAVFLPMQFMSKTRHVHVQKIAFFILQALSILSFLIWFTVGFFWRFSRAGRVASGDKLERVAGVTDQAWQDSLEKAVSADGYQIKSGAFMAIYLGLMLVLTIIVVTFSSVTATLCCCLGGKNKKNDDSMEKTVYLPGGL